MNSKWQHFYQKTYQERLALIAEAADLTAKEVNQLATQNSPASNQLIENFVSDYPLPSGVATNLVINGKTYLVPMVTEEPSVIAAASNGCQMLAVNGISARVISRLIDGQIIVKGANFDQLETFVTTNRQQLFEVANQSHPSVLKHGGGAQRVAIRKLSTQFTSIDLSVDPGEAMGANLVNTMLEAVSGWLKDQLAVNVTMAILTNFAADSLVTVSGLVSFEQLAKGSLSGKAVAQRIADASQVAQLDPRRATTHNKGIMNGIDAAAVAFGNDWRAIESAVHAYAARSGQYRGLSQWQVADRGLAGKLTLPIPIGFVGGATSVFPLAKINQQIAKLTSAGEEMQLLAAIGLAQNLAALKALVTEGIQRGHMSLQLKSLAMANGATESELPQVVAELKKIAHVSAGDVKQILKQLRR